jgi:pilus assembly protein Flp/PilA
MNVATWKQLLLDESGQDLIEYALVAALVALGAITAMKGLATGISTAFSTVSSDLSSAVA